MPSLEQYLKDAGVPETMNRSSPLWRGPESDHDLGGVTQTP